MKLSRLRGRKVCAFLLRKGLVWKGRTMHIRYLRSAPRYPGVDPARPAVYVGTIASAKLDKSAVRRNRMRRRCREALRVALKDEDALPVVQLLIAPRSSSLGAPYDDIRRDVRAFLSFLHGHPEETR